MPSKRKRKIDPNETICLNCEQDFVTNRSLIAHGSPEVCAKRKSKGWGKFTCQHEECGKTYSKYVGPNRDKKGQKFCSVECAAKAKSLISIEIKCLNHECGNIFSSKDHNRKYCSRACWNSITGYTVKDSSKMGGVRDGGGKSRLHSYTNRFNEEMKLNKEEIEVAQFLDTTNYIWQRNWTGFKYVAESGENRKFYPDFYILGLDIYLEYKGWVTNAMNHKMNHAQEINPDLNLLIVVGRNKRYTHYGVPIDDLLSGQYTL